MVALCCPLCTETLEVNPNAYIRRIDALAWIRAHDSKEGSCCSPLPAVVQTAKSICLGKA